MLCIIAQRCSALTRGSAPTIHRAANVGDTLFHYAATGDPRQPRNEQVDEWILGINPSDDSWMSWWRKQRQPGKVMTILVLMIQGK